MSFAEEQLGKLQHDSADLANILHSVKVSILPGVHIERVVIPSPGVGHHQHLESPFGWFVLVVLLEGQPTTKRDHALVDCDLLVRRELLSNAFTKMISEEANFVNVGSSRAGTSFSSQ